MISISFFYIQQENKSIASCRVQQLSLIHIYLFNLGLCDHVLVGAIEKLIVDRSVFDFCAAGDDHHWGVKGCKVSPCNQYGDNQHIADGLSSLKLHHTAFDQVGVSVFTPMPATHNGIEQHPVKSNQSWQIKRCGENSLSLIHISASFKNSMLEYGC